MNGAPRHPRAIVTGAAGGIGSAIAERLLADGMSVCGLDADEAALAHVSTRLAHDRFRSLPIDLRDHQAAVAAVDDVAADWGGVDILVNAAGVISRRVVADLDIDEWDRLMEINLRAPFVLAKACVAHMSAGAVIVNITSIQATVASAELVHYATSKAGLRQLTKALAVALGPQGIRVVAVAPGTTATAMNERDRSDPATHARYLAGIPLGRIVQPADIAAAVSFMCGSEAAAVTGTTLVVDGGFLAKR